MTYDYFYGLQAEQFSFYRVPKALFTDAHLCGLSTDAKLLYGILLDRMYLSARNGWQDKESRVYIFFTIDEIKDSIRCAEKKAIKLLDELDCAGLIERKRQGLGKPNLIYVKNFIPTLPKGQFLNCQNDNSGTVKNTTPELSEAQGSNTYVNNTEINDTDFNPIQKRHQRGKLVNGKSILTDDSDNIRVFQLDNLLIKSFQPGGQLFNLFCNTVTLGFEFFNAGIQNCASFQGVGSLP